MTEPKTDPIAPPARLERSPEEQRAAASIMYSTAAVAAQELARVLNARAKAILAADHVKSLHLAHDMIDANNALQNLTMDAQAEHGKSLRLDRAHFLALASGPAEDASKTQKK